MAINKASKTKICYRLSKSMCECMCQLPLLEQTTPPFNMHTSHSCVALPLTVCYLSPFLAQIAKGCPPTFVE